jgi:hypothetical protein
VLENTTYSNGLDDDDDDDVVTDVEGSRTSKPVPYIPLPKRTPSVKNRLGVQFRDILKKFQDLSYHIQKEDLKDTVDELLSLYQRTKEKVDCDLGMILEDRPVTDNVRKRKVEAKGEQKKKRPKMLPLKTKRHPASGRFGSRATILKNIDRVKKMPLSKPSVSLSKPDVVNAKKHSFSKPVVIQPVSTDVTLDDDCITIVLGASESVAVILDEDSQDISCGGLINMMNDINSSQNLLHAQFPIIPGLEETALIHSAFSGEFVQLFL